MSDRNDINRRKALKTTGGIGAALTGIPATVAGDSDSVARDSDSIDEWSDEKKERKLREIKRELNRTPLAVGEKNNHQHHTINGIDSGESNRDGSDTPRDVNLFVGKNRNATVPSGDPFAIEEKDEWLNREAPPGFDSPDGEYQIQSVPDLYVQEDLGSVSIQGYSVEVGIGFGIKFATKAVFGAKASVTVDFFVNGLTITPYEFTVEVGISEDGLCVKEIKFSPPQIPGKITASACFDFGVQLQDGDVSVYAEGGLNLCLNLCSPVNCSVCKNVGLSVNYPN